MEKWVELLTPDRTLCLALKAAGMPQESYFKWFLRFKNSEEWEFGHSPIVETWTGGDLSLVIAAPTSAELGEMLPVYIDDAAFETQQFFQATKWINRDWICGYGTHVTSCHFEEDAKEANARARLLIWAAKQGHVFKETK